MKVTEKKKTLILNRFSLSLFDKLGSNLSVII